MSWEGGEAEGCLATPDFPACPGYLKETVGGGGVQALRASREAAWAQLKSSIQWDPGVDRVPENSWMTVLWSVHASEQE